MATIAWRKLYGAWPKPWELACIFLHDVGHIGTNFWDNPEEKLDHWRLGAEIADFLFGVEGYLLCAGHEPCSGCKQSKLYLADRHARLWAPTLLLLWDRFADHELRRAQPGWFLGIRRFREHLQESINRGEFISNHEIYLKMLEERDETA
jgi:hypothetical protein